MEVTDSLGEAAAAAIQTISSLEAGNTYIISCDARVVVGSSAELLIERLGGGDADSVTTASTTFTPLSFEFTPLSTTDYTLNLRESGASAGDVCEFKNISVMEKFS